MTSCAMWGPSEEKEVGALALPDHSEKPRSSLMMDHGCNYVFHIKSHVPIDCTFAASQKFNLQDATYYELHICLVTEKDSRELVIRKSANFCGFSLCLTMLRSCASLPASRPVL
jgi:hypothetical protein